VADLLREVLPDSAGVLVPPDWDRSYTECFGFTLEQIYAEAGRSFETKLRSAGMPVEELPGPIPYPFDLSPDERAERMLTLLQGGILGERTAAAARDPRTMAALFDSLRRGVDHRTAPEGPLTLQWDFPDAEPWHLRVDNGSTAAVPGRAPQVDLEVRVGFEDWVDIVAGRLDPRKAVATGRLRPRGNPRALWRARGLFSA
jgi:hypothetical protein